MFSFEKTAEKAAAEFGLSMKDDPTLWPEGSAPTLAVIQATCNTVATENARSAMSRGLGKIAELVATECDVAIAEDGPLADLESILAEHLEDGPDIDLSAVLAAPDWQARVEAVREAFAVAVQSFPVPWRSREEVALYIELDPRLAKLGVAATSKPDVPASLLVNQGGDDWDEPDLSDTNDWDDAAPAAASKRERGKPSPGKARRTKAEIAEDEAADAALQARLDASKGRPEADTADWDEEPASEAPVPVLDAGWDDVAPVATAPTLPGLLSTAGIPDTDMAAILGLSKGYYSMIRNGKRPWPGVKPDQVQRLRIELHARREAIDAIDQALSTDAVLKPEGV